MKGILLGAVGALLMLAQAEAGCMDAAFSVGFARVDITPPVGAFIPGYFTKRFATGTAKPLTADCLAFCDGGTTGLVFSVDNIHLTGRDIAAARRPILERLGVSASRIFIASTHIHTSAATDSEYYTSVTNAGKRRIMDGYGEMLAARLLGAALAATADLAPAKMATARGRAPGLSFIRRFRMKDGSVVTNPGNENAIDHPLGESDDAVQLVRFRRTGAPDIALVNFQCHPDTVGGTLYHPDWPGVLRETFEGALGDGTHCFFINGAQGDTNHHQHRVVRTDRKNLPGVATNVRMGRSVAAVALGLWDACEECPAGTVRGDITVAEIPSNRPTADEVKWIRLFDEGRTDEIPIHGMELKTLTSPSSRARRLMNGPDSFLLPVSTLSIGQTLAFAGFPGEPFTQIGLDVKAKSPFAVTIIACLVNDSCGYLPSTRAYEEGGYEVMSSRYAAPIGDRLVSVQLDQLRRLHAAGK